MVGAARKRAPGTQSTGALAATTTYSLSCSGAGGTASASATVTVGTVADAVFPLHIESGKRYLIDAAGRPFFVHGDTPWCLITQLTRAQVDAYLDARKAQGFNTVLVELIEHALCANAPKDVYGDAPFTVPGDFSTPNEAYFAQAEYVISRAQAKGMLIMITPAYMGFGGACCEGWYEEMAANGPVKLRAYGQYLARRFRAYNNIVWVQGGDYNPSDLDLLSAIPMGIRDVETKWLQTFHGSRGTSALGYLGTGQPWLTLNDIYTDQSTVVANSFLEFGRSTMPFFLIEARYEGESGGTPTVVRAQAYQSALSGAAGHLYGDKPVWGFFAGWEAALDAPGAKSLTFLQSLLRSFAWWTLVPDTGNRLLTSGASSGADRAVAARASSGAFALLYTPSIRTLTVDMAQLGGPHVRARWYDPTSGAFTTIAGSPFAASGTRSFAPAGGNASGLGDWVLVLESTG